MPGTSDSEQLLRALEDFFRSRNFTTSLAEFMQAHTQRLLFVNPDAEQPLGNHTIFVEYCGLVERELGSFLAARGLTQAEVMAACQAARRAGAAPWATCLDYLLASTEYEAFMQLARDYAQLHEHDPATGGLDDCELPPASDDEDAGGLVLDVGLDDFADELDTCEDPGGRLSTPGASQGSQVATPAHAQRACKA